MSSTQTAGLGDLRERQAIAVRQMLESAQRAGRTQMVQTEKRAIKDLRDLDSRIAYLESEQQRAGTLAMAFKLIESAQARWRAVNAPHLVALVRAGARFEKGKLVERPDESGGDQQVA